MWRCIVKNNDASLSTVPYIQGSYLVLELTNHCNLACVHCAVSDQGHAHYDLKGYLSVDIVDALLDDLVAVRASFDALILFWLGEPLLHPHFVQVYRRIVRASMQYNIFRSIEIHSNSVLLEPAIVRVLLNNLALPQKIHCSIDAIQAETYQQIKGRNHLPLVMQNVENLIKQKSAMESKNPQIILQYIIGSNNHTEVDAFEQYWAEVFQRYAVPYRIYAGHVSNSSDRTDGILYRQLDCPTPEEQERENQVYASVMQRKNISMPKPVLLDTIAPINAQPCSGFWKSPVIDWQGNLTTCTRDNELHNTLGNLQQYRFSQLWWGETMKKHRKQVGKGCYDDLALCSTCFIPKSLNHSDISGQEIEQYTAHEQSYGLR